MLFKHEDFRCLRNGDLGAFFEFFGFLLGVFFARSMRENFKWSAPSVLSCSYPKKISLKNEISSMYKIAWRGRDSKEAEFFPRRNTQQTSQMSIGQSWYSPQFCWCTLNVSQVSLFFMFSPCYWKIICRHDGKFQQRE